MGIHTTFALATADLVDKRVTGTITEAQFADQFEDVLDVWSPSPEALTAAVTALLARVNTIADELEIAGLRGLVETVPDLDALTPAVGDIWIVAADGHFYGWLSGAPGDPGHWEDLGALIPNLAGIIATLTSAGADATAAALAAAASAAAAAADRATVAADKATVGADRIAVAGDKATVTADKGLAQAYRDAAEGFRDDAETAAASALGAPGTFATSSTSITLGLGMVALVLDQTGKLFSKGQSMVMAFDSENLQYGIVDSHDPVTADLLLNVTTAPIGAGTYADWTISPSAAASSIVPASEAEALAGVNGSKFMTPERVRQAIAAQSEFVANVRLSLSSILPTGVDDVQAYVRAYPFGGDRIAIYDGSSFVRRQMPADWYQLPLNNTYWTAGKAYDVWAFWDAGDAVVKFGTGPDWTAGAVAGSLNMRGGGAGSTALQLTLGVLTNDQAITIRFGTGAGDTAIVPARQAVLVGSFYLDGAIAVVDSRAKRLLWNMYNRADRPMVVKETADSWTYAGTAWRQMNGNANNRLLMFRGLDADLVSTDVFGAMASADTNRPASVGIGINSSTVDSSLHGYGSNGGNAFPMSAHWDGLPGLGLVEVRALERVKMAGAATYVFFGDEGGEPGMVAGITGRVRA